MIYIAHWCPPCRSFTPLLAEFYDDLISRGVKIEIIFASTDRDLKSFNEYIQDQPWVALPYNAKEIKKLGLSFSIRGIPTLIIVDPENGTIIDKDGKTTVEEAKGDVDKLINHWNLA